VPALEPLVGLRVVATANALEDARWIGDDVTVLRFAADEALAIGADAVSLDDRHAIVTLERGYVGARCRLADVERHIEWPIPTARPALGQGKVAGVPSKLWLGEGGGTLLVTHSVHAHDLAKRLGWER
jgi:hypothetical protein